MSKSAMTPTETALIDVIRVALSGDVDGVQQLCRRYVRRPPVSGTDALAAVRLKERLVETVQDSSTTSDSPLRSGTALARRATAPDASALNDEGGWIQHPHFAVDPVYPAPLRAQIESLISEHLDPKLLEQYGLTPSRAVLFTGPPGVGKSLTAAYIASRLDLPLMTVNIASIMSSLMGRTGQNLQEILSRAAEQPTVLFLDEFDALAKSRDESGDVGEVRRVVNVLLQQLDRWTDGSLLVAATNHPQLLDAAVHRRFDLTVVFELPALEDRVAYLSSHDIVLREGLGNDVVRMLALVTDGFSPADMNNWIRRIVRRAVTDNADVSSSGANRPDISKALLLDAQFRARALAAESVNKRAELAYLARQGLGWKQRPIADWLGVSHPTVGSDLKRAEVAHNKGG